MIEIQQKCRFLHSIYFE